MWSELSWRHRLAFEIVETHCKRLGVNAFLIACRRKTYVGMVLDNTFDLKVTLDKVNLARAYDDEDEALDDGPPLDAGVCALGSCKTMKEEEVIRG